MKTKSTFFIVLVSLGTIAIWLLFAYVPWWIRYQALPWNLEFGLESGTSMADISDSFTLANAFLSCIAFLCVAYTLWLQHRQLMDQESTEQQRKADRTLELKLAKTTAILNAIESMQSNGSSSQNTPPGQSTRLFERLKYAVVNEFFRELGDAPTISLLKTEFSAWLQERKYYDVLSMLQENAKEISHRDQGTFQQPFKQNESLLEQFVHRAISALEELNGELREQTAINGFITYLKTFNDPSVDRRRFMNEILESLNRLVSDSRDRLEKR